MGCYGITGRQTLVTAAAAIIGFAGILNDTVLDAEEAASTFIQRVVAETTRGGISAQATRHLEAGAVSGKHRAWMDVETNLSSSGQFWWQITSEGGSERTREKVLRAVLQAEAEARQEGTPDRAALSLDNYEFIPLETSADQTRLELRPRRADSTLIRGTLTVDADGHPLLLEGQLAKSPSFWIKSVTVVKRFTRVGGVSLPVIVESLADVRMVGRSSFAMHYSYTAVNGRPVGRVASATPSFGPSPELLALHARQ
jgi:hypothetical protein